MVEWEYIVDDILKSKPHFQGLYRAKVPGGWLIMILSNVQMDPALTFYPDPKHEWNGSSLR